jgi:hypothetical protein
MHFLSQGNPLMTAQQPLHLVATHVHCDDRVRPLLRALHRALTTPGRLGARSFHACMGHRMPHHCVPGPTRGSIRRRGGAGEPLIRRHEGRLAPSAALDPPPDNHLLAALPCAATTRLRPQLEPVT